jgi:hypothetical protein
MNQLLALTHTTADRNAAMVYLAALPSPKSRRSQMQVIRQIADWLGGPVDAIPWGALEYQHTTALRTRAMESYAPATARKYIAALKGILKHAWRLGLMDGEQYQRASDLDPIKGTSLPAGRDLTQGEINALIHACMQDSTAAGGAMPRSSVFCMFVRLTPVLWHRSQTTTPTPADQIHRQRQQRITAYISKGAQAAMQDWISLRGNEPGPMFYPVSQTGKIERTPEHMTDQAVASSAKTRRRGRRQNQPHDQYRSVNQSRGRLAIVARIAPMMTPNYRQ